MKVDFDFVSVVICLFVYCLFFYFSHVDSCMSKMCLRIKLLTVSHISFFISSFAYVQYIVLWRHEWRHIIVLKYTMYN